MVRAGLELEGRARAGSATAVDEFHESDPKGGVAAVAHIQLDRERRLHGHLGERHRRYDVDGRGDSHLPGNGARHGGQSGARPKRHTRNYVTCLTPGVPFTALRVTRPGML